MPTKYTVLGFGLVELLVSVSIMVLITSVILTRQDSFNGATLLRGQAYEVALKIREVQSTAVSASYTEGEYRNVLGVYFNTNPGGDEMYPVFRDDDNYFYESDEEYGDQGIVDPRFEVDEIRLIGTGAIVDDVSILFERPNFDAKFYTSANTAVSASVSGVEIDIRLRGSTGNTVGEVRTIEVTRTGQISVKDA
jgi:type II secretory pathway pseudopilin PulG